MQNNTSHPKKPVISYVIIEINFVVFCVNSSMLLFDSCRELTFQAKSVNLCSWNYAK